MRILIAEDDFTSRIALAGVLKKNGHEVVETVNGAAAWDTLQQPDAPRLVILDWMMPEMDGLEVLRRARALQTDRPFYIILLTVKDAPANIITGLEAGANDYLAKPFDAGELRARVEVGRRMVEMQEVLASKIEELKERESFIRAVMDHLPIGIAVSSADPFAQFSYMNDNFAKFYRTSREALAAPDGFWHAVYEDSTFRQEIKKRVLDDCVSGDLARMRWDNIPITRAGGETTFIRSMNTPIHRNDLMISAVWDITDRKRAEEALRKSEEKYRLMFDCANDAILIHDEQGWTLEANQLAFDRLGYTYEELRLLTIEHINTPAEAQQVTDRISQLLESGQVIFETVHQCKDGSTVPTEVSARRITWDGQPAMISICRDITERKQAEKYREICREILQILNEPGELPDSIQRILATLKTRTGFDAVGIRLQSGYDFPYFVQEGFPQGFLLPENSLLGCTTEGGVCRDEDGNIRLECTCGLVISGKTDPANPLFTPCGSFWTNDSKPLLDIPLSEDPRLHPRNQCIHHDYASVALVPIRNKGRIVGLIQLNDRRKGCFTFQMIELLEGIASHIGAALMRKQADEALKAKRKQLNDIIEFLPDATLAIDTEGHVIIWNKAMEEMTNLPAAEMIGKGDYAYAIPFYGEPRPQLIDLIFADNEEIATRYPHITREGDTLIAEVLCQTLYNNKGAWVFAKASPLRDQSGTVIGAIESIRDITNSKKMEEQLRKSVAWFKALFNATSDSVILLNPDGMILDLNENAARRRNVGEGVMRGQNLFNFLPPEAAAQRHKAINQILNERRLVEFDETRSDKHYRIRLFPITDDQGAVIQVASFSRDITENKQAEEEKKKLQAQLIQAQKMEAIGTLAGGIAHDFNNILGVILGYAGMARDASPSGSAVAKYLDRVLEAEDRAATLVKQILTFSRQTNSERIPLDFAHIVREAIKFLRPTLPSTIAIRKRIDTNTKPILANPTQVHQILINLCSNAFHAMEQTGGTLDITVRNCDLCRHDLQYQPEVQPGKFVELSISDTGHGINSEIRSKIFDPYFTTKKVGKGTGMGLSIVHGIVKSYGGLITCESELGRRTVFRVFFPAIEQEITPVVKQVEAVPLGKEHILLIEDEEIMAEMWRVTLEKLGYEVTVQTNSLNALDTFQKQTNLFDAVITDQTMPGMTGSDLARRMLQIRPDLPIILCTGYSNLISEKKAKSMGIKGFAAKPLHKNDLAVLLRKILDENNRQTTGI